MRELTPFLERLPGEDLGEGLAEVDLGDGPAVPKEDLRGLRGGKVEDGATAKSLRFIFPVLLCFLLCYFVVSCTSVP